MTSATPRFGDRDGLKIADKESKFSSEIDDGNIDSTISSPHDRTRVLESLKDPTKDDMPILKFDNSSYDIVALGRTNETLGDLKIRASMSKDELRTGPIKFEYITTECTPGNQKLGTERRILVILSDLEVAVNEVVIC